MWNRESAVKREKVREPEMAPAVSPALPVEERRVVAWVGKSVVFKGSLTSSEDMTIDGHVEGTIEVRGQGLTIGPDANIRAQIVAGTVTIHGTVIGNIRANAKIDIRATGCMSLLIPDLASGDAVELAGHARVRIVQRDKRPRTESLLQHKEEFPIQGYMTCNIEAAYRLAGLTHPRRRLEKRARVTSASSTDQQAPQ